jgi:hypothetical protein
MPLPFHGSKGSIGTSAVQLIGTSTLLDYGVEVKADPANSGTVYVGLAGVTNGNASATDGFPLLASHSLFVPKAVAKDASLIYVIASGAGQKVFFIGA